MYTVLATERNLIFAGDSNVDLHVVRFVSFKHLYVTMCLFVCLFVCRLFVCMFACLLFIVEAFLLLSMLILTEDKYYTKLNHTHTLCNVFFPQLLLQFYYTTGCYLIVFRNNCKRFWKLEGTLAVWYRRMILQNLLSSTMNPITQIKLFSSSLCMLG